MAIGKFIVIEGLDYSGKTTLAKKLVEHLNNMGIVTVHTSCSSKQHKLAQLVKSHILDADVLPSVDTQAMLYAACINDLVDTVILPAINSGKWVVCERYTLSNRIYQTHSLLTNSLVSGIDRRIKPDLTIVLDITPQEHKRRSLLRDTPDAMERVSEECLTARRKQYRLEVRRCNRTVQLDSTHSPETLLMTTLQVIRDKIK